MQRWLSTLAEAAAQEHRQAVTATFLDGAVGRTLEDYVARPTPNVVVMATQGRGGPAGDAAFRRVLVPLDGSKLAEQVLEPARALAAPGDTEYTLMTVVEPPQLSTPSVMMAVAASETASAAETLAQIAALRQAAAEQYLGLVGNQLRRRGVAVRTQVAVHPQPAQGILVYAATSGTDLIAVATHGLGGLARLLVGSAADNVIRGASAPVLVVHPTDRKRAAK